MMIAPDNFFNFLIKNQIDFFTGVPDSLLKDICAYISDHSTNSKHIITANEGNAIALATGHYLSSKKLSLVYMQNSGLGNAINPLTSLTNSEVYSITIILMIGWRGAPNIKDEPQHLLPGQITPKILDLLNIDYKILDHSKWQSQLENLIDIVQSHLYTDKQRQLHHLLSLLQIYQVLLSCHYEQTYLLEKKRSHTLV